MPSLPMSVVITGIPLHIDSQILPFMPEPQDRGEREKEAGENARQGKSCGCRFAGSFARLEGT